MRWRVLSSLCETSAATVFIVFQGRHVTFFWLLIPFKNEVIKLLIAISSKVQKTTKKKSVNQLGLSRRHVCFVEHKNKRKDRPLFMSGCWWDGEQPGVRSGLTCKQQKTFGWGCCECKVNVTCSASQSSPWWSTRLKKKKSICIGGGLH